MIENEQFLIKSPSFFKLKHLGWKLFPKWINKGHEIRGQWLENCQKIDKRTPTCIR